MTLTNAKLASIIGALGGSIVAVEAICAECGETFIPDLSYVEEDGGIFHIETSDGDECGGFGEVVGAWR